MTDVASLKAAAFMARKMRYFSESVDSSRLTKLPASAIMNIQDFSGKGQYEAEGTVGGRKIKPAFTVDRWFGFDAPLIIYHHGAAEGRCDFSYRKIFNSKAMKALRANTIFVTGPFCRTNGEFIKNIRSLERYTSIIAGSAALVEEIIRHFRRNSSMEIIVTGTSLGGAVSLLHKLAYDSADLWLPLYAGPNLGHVFTESAYSVICERKARENEAKTIREVLDFGDEFSLAKNRKNVFPLLGRHDMIFYRDIQAGFFEERNITLTEKGHSTGATSFNELSKYISGGVGRVSLTTTG